MPFEVDIAPRGLYSDSAAQTAPPGAMRQADDVVIRTPGVVESREVQNEETELQGAAVDAVLPHRDTAVAFQTKNGSLGLISRVVATAGAAEVTDSIRTAVASVLDTYDAPDGYYVKGAQDRGSLYYTAKSGVRKIPTVSATGTLEVLAGLPPTPMPLLATGGALDYYYRTLVRRTDENGYVLRSVPSPPVRSKKLGVITQSVRDYRAGDVLEVYRTPEGFLTDDLQLAFDYEITASAIAAGELVVEDKTPEGSLGATIYTAQSQEGILERNDRPPVARDLAVYQGSLFYANCGHAYETFISLNSRVTDSNSVLRPGNGQLPAGNVSVTAGAASINIAAVQGRLVAVGMVLGPILSIWGPGGFGTGYATILSFDATAASPQQILMSKNSLITNTAGRTPGYYDTVRIGDESFAWGATAGVSGNFTTAAGGFQTMGTVPNMMVNLARAINKNSVNYRAEPLFPVGASGVENPTIRVYAKDGTITATLVSATPPRGSASNASPFTAPQINRYLTWTDKSFLGWGRLEPLRPDYRANRIMWSKPLQPEAVPRVHEAYVGSASFPILRILPTRDALFILKEDGIWTLTGPQGAGAPPFGWNIRPFDPTLSLLTPESATVLNDKVYGWFSQGFHVVTAGGSADISVGRIDDQLESLQLQLARGDRTSKRAVGVGHSAYDNEVYLLVPEALPETDGAQYVFVWNENSQTWVRWTGITADFVGDFPGLAAALFGHNDGVISYPASTATARTKGSGVTAVVEWRGKDMDAPSAKKRWRECHFVFDNANAATSVQLDIQSSNDDASATATETFASRSSGNSRSVRFRVPRNHARASEVYPKLTLAGGDWRLVGASLLGEPYSARTTR